MYIETKTNEFFSLSRRHGLFGGANCKEKERRNKGDFLAPFSTRIQLKKKKNHYYHTLLSQRAHKNNKATFASHPFSGYYYSILLNFFFWKIVSTERRRRGRILLLWFYVVSVNYNNQINHRILFLCFSPAICVLLQFPTSSKSNLDNLQLHF